MENSNAFSGWAIVEVMGHHVYAGHVTEQTVAGAALIRVDVPEASGRPAYTKLLGAGSIYAITPCSEEIARARAAASTETPVSIYDLPDDWQAALQAGRQVLAARRLESQPVSSPPQPVDGFDDDDTYDYEDDEDN